ncbi:MAG: molybdenum cofactor biosynthesis protein MoaE [Gammaproteobacteria bacterium]|nr:molybdenum cofactor biosynthesis protein MoaE [Gammaproteobacteria bacterium]
MKVVVTDVVFDPYAEVQKYQAGLKSGQSGGVVSFVGTMRNFNDGHEVSTMWLDHYPGMTEKHIEKVCEEALERWNIIGVLVVHRVGEIKPDESIVLVATWSAHRAEAFDSSRFVINYLKKRAPFWKRESTNKGQRWVEHNTEDSAADISN